MPSPRNAVSLVYRRLQESAAVRLLLKAPVLPLALLRCILGRHYTFRIHGFRLTIDLMDDLAPYRFLFGTYESHETGLLLRIARRGWRTIDVGANVGYYTCLLASLVGPSGSVLAIEPHPENARLVDRNIRQNGFEAIARVIAAAAGDRAGKMPLWFRPTGNRGDMRLTKEGDFLELGLQSIDIEVKTIDSMYGGPLPVDFVKMDVQGWECHAIRGMSEIFARSPQMTMLVEVWPYGLEHAGSSSEELLNLLREHGFMLLEVGDSLGFEGVRAAADADALRARYPAQSKSFVNILATRDSSMYQRLLPKAPALATAS